MRTGSWADETLPDARPCRAPSPRCPAQGVLAAPPVEPRLAGYRGQGERCAAQHSATTAQRSTGWLLLRSAPVHCQGSPGAVSPTACCPTSSQIGVRNAVLRGTLRLTLAPLLGDLPLVGAARLSLLGMPGERPLQLPF